MRLLHYSAQPLTEPIWPTVEDLRIGMKPFGLWVSVEGEADWLEWCRGEQFALDRLAHVTEITLRPDANILRLSTPADIDLTHNTYAAEAWPGDTSEMSLDWSAIAALYDGIIIAPYQWQRRLDWRARWYYGWDCASGCIWQPRAISTIRPA